MDLLSTLPGSLVEHFFPKGWNLGHIDRLADLSGNALLERRAWWNTDFEPVPCNDLSEFDVRMGHEIALTIKNARDAGHPLAMILPVGPMGMYKWTVLFLKEWKVSCDHIHCFNMDEWADAQGNTLPGDHPGSFQYAMENAFYQPLGELSVPKNQRHFAWKDKLPTYGARIADLKAKGAKLVVVFGIGRVCHIAFWEPHFAEEFSSVADWKKETHRLGAKLHPLTIEQNALTSFRSRTTLVPAYANTIGPGLFLQAEKIIGGCDGIFGRTMQWQGLSLRMSLAHEPTPWIPSSFMPTQAGRLFLVKELLDPLIAECN
jgi:glucosamine-6-phosphate deaminase